MGTIGSSALCVGILGAVGRERRNSRLSHYHEMSGLAQMCEESVHTTLYIYKILHCHTDTHVPHCEALAPNIQILNTVMRPCIAYTHNEPCATLIRHFCDDLGRFTLKDDKGRQGTTHFTTICDVLYHSTILYSAPFHFCDIF